MDTGKRSRFISSEKMKPKKVSGYLFGTLIVYFFLVFFMVGIFGNLLVSTIIYFKLGHWALRAGIINASLTLAVYCAVPVGGGIWVLSWLKGRKDSKRH